MAVIATVSTSMAWFLFPSVYICRQYMRIFSAGVAQGAQEFSFSKTGGPELGQEGTAFPGSGNSGKPVRFVGFLLRRQRLTQDNFGAINYAAGLHNTG